MTAGPGSFVDGPDEFGHEPRAAGKIEIVALRQLAIEKFEGGFEIGIGLERLSS